MSAVLVFVCLCVAQFPEDAPCSEEARLFILALLTADSSKRPTAQDALQHPFLKREIAEDEVRHVWYCTSICALVDLLYVCLRPQEEEQTELWKTFKELRVSELPEDKDERRKRINKVACLWYVRVCTIAESLFRAGAELRGARCASGW